MVKCLVIIPVYNEEKKIQSVIRGVGEHLPLSEILIVDDGSPDNTRQKAEAEGVRVISLTEHPRVRSSPSNGI